MSMNKLYTRDVYTYDYNYNYFIQKKVSIYLKHICLKLRQLESKFVSYILNAYIQFHLIKVCMIVTLYTFL